MSQFGRRLTKAMEYARLNDAALAAAITKLLYQERRLEHDKQIPEQTIQSARTRLKGSSKYSLEIAKICGVDAYWLAYGIGHMIATEPVARHAVADSGPQYNAGWPFSPALLPRLQILSTEQRLEMEGGMKMMLLQFEKENQVSDEDVPRPEVRRELQRS